MGEIEGVAVAERSVFIVDDNTVRRGSLTKLFPEGTDVWGWDADESTWRRVRGSTDPAPESVTILMQHLGDSLPGAGKGEVTVYYGATGPGDDRFHGKGESVPATVVWRVPADLPGGEAGWLLQRKLSSAKGDLGVTLDEVGELLTWACSRQKKEPGEVSMLPRVLVPPFAGKDESAFCALAFLCQCELAAQGEVKATGIVLAALQRMGLVDESGQRVDLGTGSSGTSGLKRPTWRQGLGAASLNTAAVPFTDDERRDVDELLARIRNGEEEPIEAEVVAKAYLALDRYLGGEAA